MNTVEKPLALTDFRMALAGPLGPCRRPPTPKRVREWVDMGMPYEILPGEKRKKFPIMKCIAWLSRHGVKRGDENL